MRVCMIYDGDYPWDVRVEKVASTLLECGFEVHLVCRNLSKQRRYEALHNLHIHRLPSLKYDALNHTASFPAFFNPLWLKTISRVVKQYSIDILVVRDLPLALSAIAIGRLRHMPVLFDMAEDYPAMVLDIWRYEKFKYLNIIVRNPFLLRALEGLCTRLVNVIMTVTEESRLRLLKKYRVDGSKVFVVSNTPPLAQIHSQYPVMQGTLSSQAIRLIYVGGLQPGRNLEVPLQGMALSRGKLPCSLTVIGSGSAESVLKNTAHDLGLQDKVFFQGWIRHASVGNFLAASDIGVIPHPATQHTNTTVPNKLFDYMAYGMPVLASDTKPVQRIIDSERCGLIYKHDSPADFCQKLMQLADPTLRREMGGRARLAIQERYNWECDSKDLLKALHTAFGRDVL